MAILSNTGSMTLSQFMTEAKYFGKSQEYYDLLREASELDLMATFIETQDFIRIFNIEDPNDYGLMMEADEKKVDNVKDKWYTKVGSFFGKIGKAILKALKAFGAMIKGIIERWQDKVAYHNIKGMIYDIYDTAREKFKDHDTEDNRTSKEFVKSCIRDMTDRIRKHMEGFEYPNDASSNMKPRFNSHEDADIVNFTLAVVAGVDDAGLKDKIYENTRYAIANTIVELPEGVKVLKEYNKKLIKIVTGKGNDGEIEELLSKIKDTNKMSSPMDISVDSLRKLYNEISKTHDIMEKALGKVVNESVDEYDDEFDYYDEGIKDFVRNAAGKVKSKIGNIRRKSSSDDNTPAPTHNPKGGNSNTALTKLLKEYLNMINTLMTAFQTLMTKRHECMGRLKNIVTTVRKWVKAINVSFEEDDKEGSNK